MQRLTTATLAFMAGTALLALSANICAQEFTVDEEDATSKESEYSPFVDRHVPVPV